MTAKEKKKEYDRKYYKQYYLDHKDKIIEKENSPEYKARKQQYYIDNREKRRAENKRWSESEHGQKHTRNYTLNRKYSISLNDYNKILEEQKGCCKICNTHNSLLPEKHRVLKVDHNHETGKVRGLLCNDCNIGIGILKENIETLQSAINYLTFYK